MENKKQTTQVERDKNLAFRKWLRQKRKQHKYDKKVERYKNAELVDDHLIRTQEDCNKVFKTWLHDKNKESRQKREEVEKNIKLQAMIQKRKKEEEKKRIENLHSKPFML
ncbi:glutamic acid-rich protein-like [Saccostrea cucullata]|uniref:glutamic acid-rich protein-like n=1 Tax=Saccostrea cuccullata TaxID=36930 RepID=UPI002ED4090C